MTRAGLYAASLLASGLLVSCVSPPLYVGPPRPVTASSHADPAGPGYSGLIHDGVARRRTGRELTTGSEVPRDALGNLAVPETANPPSKPRHRRKHWFGL